MGRVVGLGARTVDIEPGGSSVFAFPCGTWRQGHTPGACGMLEAFGEGLGGVRSTGSPMGYRGPGDLIQAGGIRLPPALPRLAE